MKKVITFLIVVIVLDLFIQAFFVTALHNCQADGNELQVRFLEERHNVADEAMMNAVSDPSGYFSLIQASDEWEEIDAVPYSLCFRHLIGTTTADFILCQAR